MQRDNPYYNARVFQSTPPVWAETPRQETILKICSHFNPLRPCGRRQGCSRRNSTLYYFNPLRPCGRRRHCQYHQQKPYDFNPLRPCGRRPYAGGRPPRPARHFNPLRPCGRRQYRWRPWFLPQNFNPLRPCGRRQQKKPFFRLLSISITTYFTEKSKRTRCKFSHLGYLFQYSLLILVRTSLYVDV